MMTAHSYSLASSIHLVLVLLLALNSYYRPAVLVKNENPAASAAAD